MVHCSKRAAGTRPGEFEAIGSPALRGRSFKETDAAGSQHVGVVNEEFARKFFPESSASDDHFEKSGGASGGRQG